MKTIKVIVKTANTTIIKTIETDKVLSGKVKTSVVKKK